MAKTKKNDWTEAKKRCRLNQADIQMAKELGMKPKSLLKNIPSPNQKWKLPVKFWVRDLYEKKFGKVLRPEKNQKSSASKKVREVFDEEELPF